MTMIIVNEVGEMNRTKKHVKQHKHEKTAEFGFSIAAVEIA